MPGRGLCIHVDMPGVMHLFGSQEVMGFYEHPALVGNRHCSSADNG